MTQQLELRISAARCYRTKYLLTYETQKRRKMEKIKTLTDINAG
jgi:hypothetical protein